MVGRSGRRSNVLPPAAIFCADVTNLPVRCNNPLGIIIYEMLAGAAPFHAKAAMAFMRQHMVAEPPDLRTRVPQVSKELHELVHAMLAKEPHARPDMTQVMEQLRRIMGGGSSRIGDTLVVETPAQALPERRATLLWVGGTGLAVLLLLGVLWAVWGRKVTSPSEPVTPKEATSVPAPPPQPQVVPPRPQEVQPALDLGRPDARSSPPPAVPPREPQDAGSPPDGLSHDAAEPEPAQRIEPEPSPPPVETAEPPPAPASTPPPHAGSPKGKHSGKAQPSRSENRHHGTKPRGKHGRSR